MFPTIRAAVGRDAHEPHSDILDVFSNLRSAMDVHYIISWLLSQGARKSSIKPDVLRSQFSDSDLVMISPAQVIGLRD